VLLVHAVESGADARTSRAAAAPAARDAVAATS